MAKQANLSPEAQNAIEEYLAERSGNRAETFERAGLTAPVPSERPKTPVPTSGSRTPTRTGP